MSDILPKAPKDTLNITKCNPLEREECTIYKNEIQYMKEQQLDRITRRDKEWRHISFSGMERDINSELLILCKIPGKIPKSCPKFTNYTWEFNMDQLILVLINTAGTDYEKEAEQTRSAFADVPNVNEMIINRLDKVQEYYRNLPDEKKIIERLKLAGLAKLQIETELEKLKEAAVINSLLTWTFKYGIRCLNCQCGEINKETETCNTCKMTYSYTYKRTIKMLEKIETMNIKVQQSSSQNTDSST